MERGLRGGEGSELPQARSLPTDASRTGDLRIAHPFNLEKALEPQKNAKNAKNRMRRSPTRQRLGVRQSSGALAAGAR